MTAPRVGVDEAGKGPVLGPMVVAAVRADPDALPDGVADSKTLDASRRERLDERIRDVGTVATTVVPVERIDDPATDMNGLTVDAHAAAAAAVFHDAVAAADVGANEAGPDTERDGATARVVCDAADTNADRFARRVQGLLADGDDGQRDADSTTPAAVRDGLAVDARHGADEDDPVVSAASVVAKVERDARVAAIAAEYGTIGSGYPSDEQTRTFLREYVAEHDALPDCARSSWATSRDVLAAAEQSGLEEF